jgi:predicted dehydrogenase
MAFRVLLVGAGPQAWESRGPSILALAGEDVHLAALASPNEERRLRAARRLGIDSTYASLEEALVGERFDGVVVTAPNRLHEALSVQALEAGCHVLCEKPMATDAAGARRMVDAAGRADRVLAIGYQYPWMHPGLTALAGAGELSSTFRVEGHWTRADGIPPQPAFWDDPTAGAAGDLLGHLLSVIRIGVTARPLWASAFAWNRFGRRAHGDAFAGHDTLEATVAFDGGVTAHLVVAWAMNMATSESIGVSFHGTDASVEVPLMGHEADLLAFRPTVTRRMGAALERTVVADPLPVPTEDALVLQARDWVEACRGRGTLSHPAQSACDVQAMLDAVMASAARGGPPVDVEV